jgi:hypothetical protein
VGTPGVLLGLASCMAWRKRLGTACGGIYASHVTWIVNRSKGNKRCGKGSVEAAAFS